MADERKILERIISEFSVEKFDRFFREKSSKYRPIGKEMDYFNDDDFKDGIKLGEIEFSEADKVLVAAFKVKKDLTDKSGKKKQYEKAKNILRERRYQDNSAGVFIFYDDGGNFRFSLVYPEAMGIRRVWSNFRRLTYFVSKDPEVTNKTFLKQIGEKEFKSLTDIKDAFSITAVTEYFYRELYAIYDEIIKSVMKENKIKDYEKTRDFILLFIIRTIFLGFIQKRKWLGGDQKFIQNYLKEYKAKYAGKNLFYSRWLNTLFLNALSSEPGYKLHLGHSDISKDTLEKLQNAPYLNGGLFKLKEGYDDNNWIIPDKDIEQFFEFLFAHSFTIEENSPNDEDLELNPEFLGIIFERFVNKADGSVYTPRTEVDLMCRLSLLKWLEKNLGGSIAAKELYELFFKESEKEEDQKEGSFSPKEAKEISGKLENITVCDPAVGSGAFLVGMMQVLDEVELNLSKKTESPQSVIYNRKKQIIRNCLYGVEVKEWAVWICQLRLWLSLFVDAPDELKNSKEAILPSLDFKVRQGDSLVQRIGSTMFPVAFDSAAGFSRKLKEKIEKLKELKADYFDNKRNNYDWSQLKAKELEIYEDILAFEIEELEEKIKNKKQMAKVKTQKLFEEDKSLKQQDLHFEDIKELEAKRDELLAQKKLLTVNKPLIWSIEFAEVFAEKEGFDIVIGNPPYVRQEAIADPTGKVKEKKDYKNLLAEMVRKDFPDKFSHKTKIDAKSDLYAYFYIRALKLLNPKGVHCFICSNSWLDVGYGTWLQEFLLKSCPVELIIDNHAKRSFSAADVNTIISIIGAPRKSVNENHIIKFVAFKRPFEESIYTENMMAIENATEIISNDTFRVYPITVKELYEAGMEYEEEEGKQLKGGKYAGDKWGGKYLRAPDIFFTILKKGKGKLVKLGDIAEVRFGIKTGCNEFFYLTDEQAKEWGIEEEFLKPVIKSPRECKSILINPKDLKYKIFMCNKSKAELKGTNALKYIQWGERQSTKNDDGKEVLWKDVPSVQGRKYWWGLGEREIADGVIPCSYLGDFIVYKNCKEMLVDKRMYELYTSDGQSVIKCLNSTIYPLLLEILTRNYGGGGGPIDATVEEIERIFVLRKECSSELKKYDLPKRLIKSIFLECGIDPSSPVPIEEQEPKPLPDRAELDKIVFDALGLTSEERREVYRAVCRLVWNRISKARSV
ncbi:MAG TPA: Eco57I restriction-modification methylase domain-containing protein [Acidobacteriota bacterium]|nr:Eco57I restriction-modification methylase domain-containing protein [Acidobacteriota bacterium]